MMYGLVGDDVSCNERTQLKANAAKIRPEGEVGEGIRLLPWPGKRSWEGIEKPKKGAHYAPLFCHPNVLTKSVLLDNLGDIRILLHEVGYDLSSHSSNYSHSLTYHFSEDSFIKITALR